MELQIFSPNDNCANCILYLMPSAHLLSSDPGQIFSDKNSKVLQSDLYTVLKYFNTLETWTEPSWLKQPEKEVLKNIRN